MYSCCPGLQAIADQFAKEIEELIAQNSIR